MQQELFSLSDVARILACKPHRILYLLSNEPWLNPRLKIAGKRLWTIEEIVPISERLKLNLDLEGGAHA